MPDETPLLDTLALPLHYDGRMKTLDARAGRVVELRFFGGLSERETADVLGISVATLKRDWNFARVWLLRELRSSSRDPG